MIDALKQKIKSLPLAQQQQVLANISKMPERERIELMSLVDEIDARKQRKVAQGGLLDFVHAVYPNYMVGAHHKRLAKLLEEAIRGDKKRIIVNIAPRMGKLIADETPVPTPTGWTTHGELRVGDYVYHPEGHAVKVVALSGKAPADVRMDFTNGESVWCHEAHEWKLYNAVRKQWEIKEAGHFLQTKDHHLYTLPVIKGEESVVGLSGVTADPQGKVGHCIQVDSPDGLYVVGKKMITTHNSELVSYLFPAWFLGHHPDKKIIMATHTADLSVNFGRRVRDLVNSDEYKNVFPKVALNPDAKAAGQWNTSDGGQYYAAGVGGALAGRGADVFVIDDPHSEQEAKTGNPAAFLPAWEWFQAGPLQRLMPNGVIIVVMTRWGSLDLTGQLTNHMIKNPDADQWEVVEFPAILDENMPTERSLWPEFWPLEELKKKRAGMDARYWSSQYLQNPSAEGAQLIKKEWWKHWDKEDPPQCEYTIMSLDAAQESHNRADYNAITHWGIFFNENTNQNNIMLLNAWKARMEFPELKRRMIEEYNEWEPDTFIVEKKSSGAALYQELRSMGMPVSEFTPSRGNDKISRVNSISDLFASGMVWAPTDRRWAQEVITECAEFPVGLHDDMVDSVSQALIRFRKGGFIRLPSDEAEDDVLYRYKKKAAYY